MTHAFDVLALPCTGRVLVEASAGTGKTYTLSTLFLRLLLERGLHAEQILVVTFTEAATSELRQRIRSRLTEALQACEGHAAASDPALATIVARCADRATARARLQHALSNFDRVPISTIHGFCRRVLTDNAFRTRAAFNAELLKDTRELSREAVLDHWARRVAPGSLYLAEYLQEHGYTPNELAQFAHWVAHARPLRILPELSHELAPPSTVEFESAYAAARAAFEHKTVEQLLLKANLHGGKYKKQSIVAWCREFKAYFGGNRPSLLTPASLRRLRPSEMRAAQTRNFGSKAPEHPFFEACEDLHAAQERLSAELAGHFLRFKADLIETLQEQLPDRKRALGVVSFDDLLHQVHDALLGPGGEALAQALRHEFPAALIDEFQDTDPVQYAIFDTIYAGGARERSSDTGLFLIGDPKQAIYSFRGADIFAYLKAAASVPQSERHTMTTNYRSDEALVDAVNSLFSRLERPFLYEWIDYPMVSAASPPRGPLFQLANGLDAAPLQFRFMPRAPQERRLGRVSKRQLLPRWVASEVRELLTSDTRLGERRLLPQDFAVLTRTNEEAFDCQRALLEAGIPAVVLGDRSVYEQPDAAELQLLLKAIAEPGHMTAIRTALVTDLMGLDASALHELDLDERRWDEWLDRFRSWNERWHQHGFVQTMRQVLSECRLPERLLARVDGERRMTNLLQLIELLHTEAIDSHLGPNGLMHFLASQRHASFHATDSEQIRLESDADAVILTTIHKSKGLEYPIVLCPTLHTSLLVLDRDKRVLFHDPAADNQLTLDLGSPEVEQRLEVMRGEALAENLRLLYVALTRAKHRTIVYWGAFYYFETSALSYLLHGAGLGAPTEATVDALKDRVKDLDDGALEAELLALGRGTAVRRLQGAPPSTDLAALTRASAPVLSARQLTAERPLGSRTASFSALIANAPVEGQLLEGRDHDDRVGAAESPPVEAEATTTLASFPSGTRTGNLFHTLLEHSDFQATDHEPVIRAALLEHGFVATGPETAQLLDKALREMLATPFTKGVSLNRVKSAQRANEMEFTLPAPPMRTGQQQAISVKRLARVFRDHPSPEVPSSYADVLERLAFTPLLGFLKGFIDLVFVHQDRWYVVDYKSNQLGPRYDDYEPGALRGVMMSSHYVLQYHLYCLAVHRHLQLRVPGYDYERDFAGAYYLFIRGMHPSHAERAGVFFEKPPIARLNALSSLFPAAEVNP